MIQVQAPPIVHRQLPQTAQPLSRPGEAQALAGLPAPELDARGWPKWPVPDTVPRPNVDLERVERVLREGGDSGQLRLALLQWAVAWHHPWTSPPKGSPPPPGRPPFPAPEAWAALLRFEDWPWQVDLGAAPLGQPLARALDAETLERAFGRVLEALAQDPAQVRLQANLAFLHGAAAWDRLDGRCARWEALEPLPGQPWPPVPLVQAHLGRLLAQERLSEILDKARRWSWTPDPRFLDAQAWSTHLKREALLKAYTQIAETRQIQTTARILEGVAALRGFAGPDFKFLIAFYLKHLPARLLTDPDPTFNAELGRLAGQPALTFPPMPAPAPPWQLKAATPAEGAALREALDRDRDLRLWLPGEGRLDVIPGLPHPVELWVGPERREAWAAPPAWDALAGALAATGGGRLRAVSDQIYHLGPSRGRRALRIPLLLARMPLPDLQDVLVEDLLATLGWALPPGGLADENLWATAAGQALPPLEAHLRAWPLDEARWEALAFWTARLPGHGGPVLSAQGQPPWQEGLPFALGLPPTLHQRVGDRLAAGGAWPQARAWFEPVWEALGDLDAKAWRQWPWLTDLVPVVRNHLGRAYGHLGLEGLRQALQGQRVGPSS